MRIAAALLAAILLVTSCAGTSSEAGGGPQGDPANANRAGTVDIVIEDGKVTPQGKRVELEVGDTITLHVTSDADEELHVHSEPEHSYDVAAGDDTTFSLEIDTPGQVAVEAHHLDVTIVQLVVRP